MKELTIEEKAERYDKALKYAIIYYKEGNEDMKMMMKTCFPVLVEESKDDKIRKMIHGLICIQPQEFFDSGFSKEEILAWLEKQVPIDEENVLIGARKDIALSIMNFLDRNTLGMCLSNLECKDLEDAVVDLDWSKVYDYVKKKLEKQGEQETLCDKCKKAQPSHSCQDITELGRCTVEHEQKPTDKTKPMFREGDWITNGKLLTGQVISFDGEYYHYMRNGVEQPLHVSNAHNWHLWTIQDAKDGDVLITVDDERPFIYKGCLDPNHPGEPVAYCGIDSEGCFNCSCIDKFNHWWTDEKVQPATKEQRDFLFQKMKEAGYEWDAEKKKLSKKEDHEYVDLGLPSGTLWAKTNIGAETETDCGYYFAWGEAAGYDNGGNLRIGENDIKINRKFIKKEYNNYDRNVADAATANWGSDWRMPTKAEIQELIDNTNSEWTIIGCVEGCKFTSKTDNTKYIFLPAAGFRINGSLLSAGKSGCYWSSSLYRNKKYVHNLFFYISNHIDMGVSDKYNGQNIRPVRTKN